MRILLIASDGQFLGKLSLNRYDIDSISYEYGLYGSIYSATSFKNQYSTYGSPYSSLSPYNPYTSTPPTIYLRGQRVGFYLRTNTYLVVLTLIVLILGCRITDYIIKIWK